MRLTSTATKLFSLFLLLAACATFSSQAIGTVPVRGGSNYGTGNNFATCAVPLPGMCGEGFNLTPVGTFDTHSIVQFAFDPSFDPPPSGFSNVLDVVDLGMIGANDTFKLPSAFFTPSVTEIFSCNNVFTPTTPTPGFETVVLDSGNQPQTGPCTPLNSVPDLTLNPDGSFTTGAAFTDLVLDSPVPIVATAEPSSLVLLLGAGLLAVGRKVRRAC
jgi:hypothetical protein